MDNLSLKDAKGLYAKTGFCEHFHVDDVNPYGCNVRILTCMVCAKELDKTYILKK